MSATVDVVSSAAELMDALESEVSDIEVQGTLTGMPMVTLRPGVRLSGGTLRFGGKGVRLTHDNELNGVTVITPPHEVAILNHTGVMDLGTLTMRDVQAEGQVLLLAQDAVRSGHVQIYGLTVAQADLRGRVARPHGFGVDALQGAFTLWNRQADGSVTITAELLDIAAGTAETPVRGSGVFVGGHGNWEGSPGGGTVRVSTLRTGEIHTDGGIPDGTPDLVSSGVFVISGASVDEVIDAGPVTTYGPNDMVLDNWGKVINWTARSPLTSFGPNGIGFVNFADIDHLVVHAPLETFGRGARGFSVYDGYLRHATFDSIITHGDGSVGVQIRRPVAILEIRRDLRTEGGKGDAMVKGVETPLQAIAFRVKDTGLVGSVDIGGKMQSSGPGVVTAEIKGDVDKIQVGGGIHATGKRSDAVHLGKGVTDLTGIDVTAANGKEIVRAAK
jgi:hypothetical protein